MTVTFKGGSLDGVSLQQTGWVLTITTNQGEVYEMDQPNACYRYTHTEHQGLPRPRTTEEVAAFQAGYAQAAIDLQTHDLTFVLNALTLMQDTQQHLE